MVYLHSGIKWHPRVPQQKLLRLYKSDAEGLRDTELLEDVAITLYLRCKSIILVGEAEKGRVHCPRCHMKGRTTIIWRESSNKNYLMVCPVCGWQATWGEYLRSYQRKQLSIGGAAEYFKVYIHAYEKAKTPSEKMLAIDRVIHQFHYNIVKDEILPTRANCVNLIEGTLTQTVKFLDKLSTGENTQAKQEWLMTFNKMKTPHPKPTS